MIHTWDQIKRQRRMRQDPRYLAMAEQLGRFSPPVWRALLRKNLPGGICYDDGNYHEGTFCPIAVALGLNIKKPPITSDAECAEAIAACGFNPRNLKGLDGEFYTTDRPGDLELLLHDLLRSQGQDCNDLFHSNMCSGMGVERHCGSCGQTWRW